MKQLQNVNKYISIYIRIIVLYKEHFPEFIVGKNVLEGKALIQYINSHYKYRKSYQFDFCIYFRNEFTLYRYK